MRKPQPTAAPHLGESSDEGEAEPNRARGSADPRGCREPGRPKDVVRDGSNQGIPWGSSGWLISRIQDKGEWVGMLMMVIVIITPNLQRVSVCVEPYQRIQDR